MTKAMTCQGTQILVAESNSDLREIPEWMKYFIDLGLKWRADSHAKRRIGLISMPCDSVAAGIVALGAMSRRLAIPDTNDITEHFRRIEALVLMKDRVTVLRNSHRRGRFVADCVGEGGLVWVRRIDSDNRERGTVSKSTSTQWQFIGEAPVQVVAGRELPFAAYYNALLKADKVATANLRHSDSGICLAGHVRGERWTQARMQEVSLGGAHGVAKLDRLLAIQGWLPDSISRVTYFNSRTDKLDRRSGQPKLVVADGDAAFLKAIDHGAFKESDVLGIYHRQIERDRLEALTKKVADLSHWYEFDRDAAASLPPLPRGISAVILRQR